MTPTRIRELRELLASTSPLPWPVERTGDGKRYVIGKGLVEDYYEVAEVYSDDCPRELAQANATLIVSAVNELSGLLDENERLRECLRDLVSAIDADRCGDDSIWDDLLNFGMGDGGPLTRARAALQQEKKG